MKSAQQITQIQVDEQEPAMFYHIHWDNTAPDVVTPISSFVCPIEKRLYFTGLQLLNVIFCIDHTSTPSAE